MKRRDFLRASLVTAGSVVLGPACGSEGSSGPPAEDAATDMPVDMGLPDTAEDVGPDAIPGPVVHDGAHLFPQSVASGDPRAGSVILWTRLGVDGGAAADLTVALEVALDEGFAERLDLGDGPRKDLVAESAFDHCVKVRLEGLDAATTYYYRFLVEADDGTYGSRTGRTRTAPSADADVPVRFAVVSCQDFVGSYYHGYRRLADEDLDFFIHLGDYIYETTGDADFQAVGSPRSVALTDKAGAIVFAEGEPGEYYAARSLDNYRELYRIYRGDGDLQRMHERFPMIATWDDHEFSDDSHGDSGTYFSDPAQDVDLPRRKNANQAWFEYMPVDYMDDPDFRYDPQAAFPGDLRIYRDLVYGKHVHVVMTDLRTWRSDHLVPEDAFPGAVAATAAELIGTLGEDHGVGGPYLDIETYQGGLYKDVLVAAGVDTDHAAGLVSAAYINGVVAAVNEAGGDPVPTLTDEDMATMDVGVAYHHVGKTGTSGSLGSRYLVIQSAFEALAAVRWAESGGASETALGETQRAWLLDTMANSPCTWKLWGNEYTLTPRRVDLRSLTFIPESLRAKFLLSAEDWDGLPNRRDQVVGALAEVGGVVAVTGDIHAFFAGTPWVESDPSKRIVEFVTGAISSGSYKTLLMNTAASDPALAAAGAVALAASADQFIMDPVNRPNPNLGYANVDENGFMILEADAGQLTTTFYAIAEKHGGEEEVEGLSDLFSVTRFRVDAGSTDLWMEDEGTWKRWDPAAFDWV